MSNDNISKIKIQVVSNPTFQPCTVRCVFQGSKFVDATHIAKPVLPHTKKLNKNEYLVLSDGEIRQYKTKEKFFRQKENLQRTFNNIRWLIRENFASDADNQLFITLTYAENMTDPKRLYTDFEHFIKRVRRKYKNHTLDYLTIAEPQGRGAWHLHIMLKSDKPVLIMDNDTVTAILWGHGNTKTKRLESDDIGTYYVAYFTDLICDDDGRALSFSEIQELTKDERSKKRVKGARLSLYPANFKFYRKSKNIKNPTQCICDLEDIRSTYGEPVFSRTYQIYKESDASQDGELVNQITKINFKKS